MTRPLEVEDKINEIKWNSPRNDNSPHSPIITSFENPIKDLTHMKIENSQQVSLFEDKHELTSNANKSFQIEDLIESQLKKKLDQPNHLEHQTNEGNRSHEDQNLILSEKNKLESIIQIKDEDSSSYHLSIPQIFC